MANRYWVGGSGTWDTSSTAHWSTSSGGASGASVPTSADSVFFDQNGPYTVSIGSGFFPTMNCLDFNSTGTNITFATGGTGPTWNIYGSFSIASPNTFSYNGALNFNGATTGKTITTNGVTLTPSLTFQNAGDWTLVGALTCTNTISVGAGTLNTGNYAINASSLSIGTSGSLNLGSSVVTLSSGFTNSSIVSPGFNAGTSSIVFTGASPTLTGPATFYNVSFTNTGVGSTKTINGINTFNNFSVTGPTTNGINYISFGADQTINGQFSTTSSGTSTQRCWFNSANYGFGYILNLNGTVNLTDSDFRDLYVYGTSSPISGTRLGNLGNCQNITFSTPKTVYWNAAGTQNWCSNSWAATSGGVVSTTSFPLPQDTAVFDNTGSVGTVTFDSLIPWKSTIDMSARTSAMTLAMSNGTTVYGNWINGSGVTFSGTSALTFAGGGTQTINSAGIAFPNNSITLNSIGGTVQLASALTANSCTITLSNGTFNTQNYAVTIKAIFCQNLNITTLNLGSSSVSLSGTNPINFSNAQGLTFNAGTSSVSLQNTATLLGSTYFTTTFYNLSLSTNASTLGQTTFFQTGSFAFNTLTLNRPSGATIGLNYVDFSPSYNYTISTLDCSSALVTQRVGLFSSTVGTQCTLTVNAFSASPADVDFRDIKIAGVATGTAITRGGDLGGNSGVTFPAPKTVYWNGAGIRNWTDNGWCTSSGGIPAANNFPLAQDTAVFDNSGAITEMQFTFASIAISSIDMSTRTSAMSITTLNSGMYFYGDFKLGTGVTVTSSANAYQFYKNGTQTITSNGVTFNASIQVYHPNGTLNLADALSIDSTHGLSISSGTFNAVTYNVTIGSLNNSATSSTIKMGSGTWTLSGTGTVWNLSSTPTLYSGTATIVLSDTSTTARTFNGAGLYYSKLTIGGTTGTSTLTISGNNTFGELASTKTVAHTISLGTTVQNFGKWSVTGTLGNVVTISGTSTTNNIYGPAVTGIDYLAMGSWGISTTSPGEFYAGANSTGTAAAPVFRTAAPAPRTLYWVGGTGNWSATTSWSTSSGGASGAAIPTSLDSVNFNSASNAIDYTATIDAGVSIARCAAFTMAGPASGNVTWAGTVPIALHGNFSLAATGVTYTGTGIPYLAGNSSYTFNTNGIGLPNYGYNVGPTVIGIGSTWTLTSALSLNFSSNVLNLVAGSFNSNGYSLSNWDLYSVNNNVRSLSLGASAVSAYSSNFLYSSQFSSPANFTLNSGTSTLTFTTTGASIYLNGLTWYNFNFSGFPNYTYTIFGTGTINRLKSNCFGTGLAGINFTGDVTIASLDVSGSSSTGRGFLASSTLGTQRTLTVGSYVSAQDIDFRDIKIAGAAAGTSITRGGNCGGNSGITFPVAKTVYYASTGSGNWSDNVWSLSSGGALDANAFPLAQDTAVIAGTTYPAGGSTITINANWNISTVDMSSRTSVSVNISTGTTTPTIYGNWIASNLVLPSGTGTWTFAGRTSQTFRSGGQTYTQAFDINSPGGSVTLQDSLSLYQNISGLLTVTSGTFNANNYNVSLTSSTTSSTVVGFSSSNSNVRTIAVGSGTWTIRGGNGWNTSTSTNLTVTGTGTINLNANLTAKTFAGGSISYSGITLNYGDSGTLTITGNNTFAKITKTFTGAGTINFPSSYQTVGDWTATGTSGAILSITGQTTSNYAALIYTGASTVTINYPTLTYVRAYPVTGVWNAVNKSLNNGSLGFTFTTVTPPPSTGKFLLMF